jgi:hypothetical protein
MKQFGLLFQLAALVRPTEGIESGLLPTPREGKTTDETEESWTKRNKDGKVATPPLGLAINMMLPTPRTLSGGPDNSAGQKRPSGQQGTTNLQGMIAMLPTPKERDWKGQTQRGKYECHSPADAVMYQDGQKTGMKLQPAFVEWMMGYPESWTELPVSNLSETP